MKRALYLTAIPFLILSAFFVAKMSVYPELARVGNRPGMSLISSLFVLVFALPSFIALVKWLGVERGIIALLVLGSFAIAVETFAVRTGFPYGHFHYGAKLGGKIFGAVPWTVPFAWIPLLLGAIPLAYRWSRPLSVDRYVRILVVALLLVAMDAVLDPGAVAQKFWAYHPRGQFYGVPPSNFFGWMLSGAVGALLFDLLIGKQRRPPPLDMLGSAFLILVFWTSVCLWSRMWVPALIGVAVVAVISSYFFTRQRGIYE